MTRVRLATPTVACIDTYRTWARKPLGFSQGMNGPLGSPVSLACAGMISRTFCTPPTESYFAAFHGKSC